MVSFEEKRECVRTNYKTVAYISNSSDESMIKAELQNISIFGMYAETPEEIDVGSMCRIQIVIDGHNSRLLMDDIDAEVIRRDDNGLGFRFTSNMEWLLLFTAYSHYEHYKDRPAYTGEERRFGTQDRRINNQDRRQGKRDRRKA